MAMSRTEKANAAIDRKQERQDERNATRLRLKSRDALAMYRMNEGMICAVGKPEDLLEHRSVIAEELRLNAPAIYSPVTLYDVQPIKAPNAAELASIRESFIWQKQPNVYVLPIADNGMFSHVTQIFPYSYDGFVIGKQSRAARDFESYFDKWVSTGETSTPLSRAQRIGNARKAARQFVACQFIGLDMSGDAMKRALGRIEALGQRYDALSAQMMPLERFVKSHTSEPFAVPSLRRAQRDMAWIDADCQAVEAAELELRELRAERETVSGELIEAVSRAFDYYPAHVEMISDIRAEISDIVEQRIEISRLSDSAATVAALNAKIFELETQLATLREARKAITDARDAIVKVLFAEKKAAEDKAREASNSAKYRARVSRNADYKAKEKARNAIKYAARKARKMAESGDYVAAVAIAPTDAIREEIEALQAAGMAASRDMALSVS